MALCASKTHGKTSKTMENPWKTHRDHPQKPPTQPSRCALELEELLNSAAEAAAAGITSIHDTNSLELKPFTHEMSYSHSGAQ